MPTPITTTAPLFENAVIKEEEKDDSEPDLERKEQEFYQQTAEVSEIKPHYYEEE